ncbi:MAG: hypothetical protein EPN65_01130 [Pandoraea sp.]|uniref:hypothetical protein n=1 Tax=Pandoraea sp. TaxID=1883445 RepID=UPI00122275EF|nr:hypothetical protein [Pandoraea sp.]TAM20348.1 MAG: hypothetical protein EPN65_01130 [Pandoraea sp.]
MNFFIKTLIAQGSLSRSQQVRIAFFEMLGFCCENLSRGGIEWHPGIKPPASNRDLITYRRLAPNNLWYGSWNRRCKRTNSPRPLFRRNPAVGSTWMKRGFKDGLDLSPRRPTPGELCAPLVNRPSRRWSIDYSEKGISNPKEYPLRLLNIQTLYGVEKALIVPFRKLRGNPD